MVKYSLGVNINKLKDESCRVIGGNKNTINY